MKKQVKILEFRQVLGKNEGRTEKSFIKSTLESKEKLHKCAGWTLKECQHYRYTEKKGCLNSPVREQQAKMPHVQINENKK